MDVVVPLVPTDPAYTVIIDGVAFHPWPLRPTVVSSGWLSNAIAGALTQLPDFPCKAVSIAARPTNTGYIFLGGAGVAVNTGRILQPGESIDITIDNLNRLYFRPAVANEGISFLWVN